MWPPWSVSAFLHTSGSQLEGGFWYAPDVSLIETTDFRESDINPPLVPVVFMGLCLWTDVHFVHSVCFVHSVYKCMTRQTFRTISENQHNEIFVHRLFQTVTACVGGYITMAGCIPNRSTKRIQILSLWDKASAIWPKVSKKMFHVRYKTLDVSFLSFSLTASKFKPLRSYSGSSCIEIPCQALWSRSKWLSWQAGEIAGKDSELPSLWKWQCSFLYPHYTDKQLHP